MFQQQFESPTSCFQVIFAHLISQKLILRLIAIDFISLQAPTSMKSVVSAAWLLTVSFGNLLVAIITKYIKFNKQVKTKIVILGIKIFIVLQTIIMINVKWERHERDWKGSIIKEEATRRRRRSKNVQKGIIVILKFSCCCHYYCCYNHNINV